jgi:hypothetical protein
MVSCPRARLQLRLELGRPGLIPGGDGGYSARNWSVIMGRPHELIPGWGQVMMRSVQPSGLYRKVRYLSTAFSLALARA